MSLINEALKKAQRQRSLEAAPLSSAPSGVAAAAVATHERTATHRQTRSPLWFGLGLLALGAGTATLILRYGFPPDAPAPVTALPTSPRPASTPPTTVAPTQDSVGVVLPPITATLQSTPPSPAPGPANPTPPPATAIVTVTVTAPSIASLSAPAPAPATLPAQPAAPARPPSPAAAPVPVAPVATTPGPAEREARIHAFISTARLTGVRGVGEQARVLMNERVYRLNDTLDADLGLRLSAVRPGLLVFTDAQGKTYEKSY